MAWLPFEDKIAGASEKLVLKYSPNWSGAGETIHQIDIPDCYKEKFELVHHEEFTKIPFTHESWNGRIKACRGIGASLTEKRFQCGNRNTGNFLNGLRLMNLIFYIMVRLLNLKNDKFLFFRITQLNKSQRQSV